ncbi:MAG TPA: hypothetical protein VLA24_15405 [Pseudomonadales bacterium]|nr:hypothetical protein [Pseudomonadales bacterium]
MALTIDHTVFKSYFNTGDAPTEAQFHALIDAVALVDAAAGQVVYKDGSNYVTGQIVKTAQVTIPTAEVLTLFTTPKPFGITVPTGYYVQPLSAQLKATYGGTPYATNIALEVGFNGVKPIFNGALNFNSNVFQNLEFEPSGTVIDNADVEVSVNVGNPTAGNSNITVYLTYILIPV